MIKKYLKESSCAISVDHRTSFFLIIGVERAVSLCKSRRVGRAYVLGQWMETVGAQSVLLVCRQSSEVNLAI